MPGCCFSKKRKFQKEKTVSTENVSPEKKMIKDPVTGNMTRKPCVTTDKANKPFLADYIEEKRRQKEREIKNERPKLATLTPIHVLMKSNKKIEHPNGENMTNIHFRLRATLEKKTGSKILSRMQCSDYKRKPVNMVGDTQFGGLGNMLNLNKKDQQYKIVPMYCCAGELKCPPESSSKKKQSEKEDDDDDDEENTG